MEQLLDDRYLQVQIVDVIVMRDAKKLWTVAKQRLNFLCCRRFLSSKRALFKSFSKARASERK
jgi:hypothetical protein